MSGSAIALLLVTAGLAAANGANDDAKGVATLAGAGVTRYGVAVAWGVLTTLAGALLSLLVASKISTLFTTGIVAAPPGPAFGLAVVVGAAAWVAVATVARLPVSTTHAIVGALIGAGLLLAPGAIAWSSLLAKVVVPLLASVAVAYVLTAVLSRLVRRGPRCVCIDVTSGGGLAPAPQAGMLALAPGAAAAAAAVAIPGVALPTVAVSVSRSACPRHRPGATRLALTVNAAHWVTAGASGFARGLNDTPKIWVLGAFALVPGTLGGGTLLLVVAGAMALGGGVAAIRVARRLGNGVVTMSHGQGFTASLTTALLVGVGANLGLPMSITHVATGAISGTAGTDVGRLNRRTLRDFLLAWTVTPLVAGLVALAVYTVTR